jgi:hypothetical protein
VFILDGHFPDLFPGDEDPIPDGGNPHGHGAFIHVNNVDPPVHHVFAGAVNNFQANVGPNQDQNNFAEEVQNMQHNEQNVGMGAEWPINLDLDNNIQAGWQAWPVEGGVVDNGLAIPQHPEHPQVSFSLESSGSTVEYFRASGPDFILRVEDILNNNFEDSSSLDEVQSPPPRQFQIMEERAFQSLFIPSAPRTVLSDTRRVIALDKALFHQEEDMSLAIVPWVPCPAAVLLSYWAECVADKRSKRPVTEVCSTVVDGNFSISVSEGTDCVYRETDLDGEILELIDSDRDIQKRDLYASSCSRKEMSLPVIASSINPVIPVEESSVRRSIRLSQMKDGYQLYQLEDHPRKKQRVWAKVPLQHKDAVKLLDNPPSANDEEVLSQIPIDIMKAWGIECSVAPEELTKEALSRIVKP